MGVSSIEQIQTLRTELREQISKIDKKLYLGQLYGSENEYSYKSMLGGMDSLLIDIGSLVKAPAIFLKMSTYQERSSIISSLNYAKAYLSTPEQLYPYIEQLKTLVRVYNIRFTNERFVELDKEISEIVAMKLAIHGEVKNLEKEGELLDESIKKLDDEKNNLKSSINDSKEIFNDLVINIDNVGNRLKLLNDEVDEIEVKKQYIQNSLNDVKSNEKLIDSFSQKIQQREIQLENIESSTNDYIKKLNEYSDERVDLIEEAQDLINSAREALNYKTAEGISASFQAQYDELKNSRIWPWLVGAAFCLVGTVALGVWILSVKTTDVVIIISRLLLLPICIIGAVFCAKQYVRYKDMIQDYAYKMVLSKSLVGFSDQIKKHSSSNEEYVHYIKTVLGEIHNDPLRRNTKSNTVSSLENINNLDYQKLEKFAEVINGLIKAVK